MTQGTSDQEIFRTAIGMAVRAPSVHNTQPWRWRLSSSAIELRADHDRRLGATDPTLRALLLSCGAALHHLQIALAVLGRRARIEYLPDPADPDRLARITVTPRPATDADIALGAALMNRQSDRRRYGPRPVPQGNVRAVSETASAFGAAARQVPPMLRHTLSRTTHTAAIRHAADPGYLRELERWSGRIGAPDGVPAANTPPPRPGDDIVPRAFAQPRLADTNPSADASEWLVVCTPSDDRRSQLRAGQAVSALLLTATSLGLASCVQTEPLGMADLRAAIRSEVLHDCAHPQAMVRLGWAPAGAGPLPFTPRRDIEDVIDQPAYSA